MAHRPRPSAPRDLPRPKKHLGQHFLHDTRTLDRIADALGPIAHRTVVEIGPGRGALTDRLVARAARLIAIEVDPVLAQHLRARYADTPHVAIIEADVLSLCLSDVAGDAFVLVGNVPYYITTPIVFHALTRPRPDVAVYLVQKEVAERMAAAPGDDAYGALSVNVQAVANVEILHRVPPGAFNPPPSVDSAVVRITPRADPVVDAEHEQQFSRFVVAAFGLRRKQLVRVVRTITSRSAEDAAERIASCGLRFDVRPEVLSPEDFARLTLALEEPRDHSRPADRSAVG